MKLDAFPIDYICSDFRQYPLRRDRNATEKFLAIHLKVTKKIWSIFIYKISAPRKNRIKV